MKVKTINIYDSGVDEINEILERNLNAGWVFLGYGMTKIVNGFEPDWEIPIMSFRHDDWTEETPFFETV